MPSPEKSMEPAPERPRLCTREKPDVAVSRQRGKSKWQRSAALRSPLASAVGAQRSPASVCRAWAAAFAECQGGGSTQVLWRSACLRLVSCRVQTRCDLLFGSLLLDTHHAFTTPLLLYLLHPNSIYGTLRYVGTQPTLACGLKHPMEVPPRPNTSGEALHLLQPAQLRALLSDQQLQTDRQTNRNTHE